ncbi:MAG: oleate hydratase [Spirochaetota bacterium]
MKMPFLFFKEKPLKKILILLTAVSVVGFTSCKDGGTQNTTPREDVHAYIVGGGIAGLTAAAFLIRDGKVPGENIHIIEELNITGGALDGAGDPNKHYVIRGGRMMNLPTYETTWELYKGIPSIDNPGKSVYDDIVEFNKKVPTNAKARVVDKDLNILNSTKMNFSWRDRWDMMRLGTMSEEACGDRKLNDYFSPGFFKTTFWYMWSTTFAFQPWSSLLEFKRYNDRFIHEFPRINTLEGVARTPYNQYDSLVLPLLKHLKASGVNFQMGTKVTNMAFKKGIEETTVEKIFYTQNGKKGEIKVGNTDIVIATIGSITADSDLGSMTSAPKLITDQRDGGWSLWKNLAKDRPEFGDPSKFSDHINESKWESFTVTLRDPLFLDKIKAWTGNDPGTGALITFRDSNWYMSIVIAYQPHFRNQPESVKVFWGYALNLDVPGNYIKKPFSKCTGEEILAELCYHLKFMDDYEKIKKSATVIPAMMPYCDALFQARKPGDRPLVVPESSTNLAFVGQFAEIPEDTVFTVEYSIRSAAIAVYTLLGMDKEPPRIYKGAHSLGILWDAAVTLFR